MYRKASKIRDKEMNSKHKRRKIQKRKSPFSFERTGARLVARAYVEIKRNEHISGIPGATLH
ncbi:hypothetical protein GA069_12065 [Vibrio parahaemolyticus]|nr:hypothetical protein [Vibrio parahaemolyticus]EGQ8198986.1 hypothetical protein [Vibrio parahaemolyticus]EGQ8550937.1 hypothetical protein [Vibrio parahaemolyticus]EGQ9073778.1 hypothetical protein [Vibrio parahaemolyticus]EGQ9130609.1 hypothetical protein [Vibrio parahaemolyticus]